VGEGRVRWGVEGRFGSGRELLDGSPKRDERNSVYRPQGRAGDNRDWPRRPTSPSLSAPSGRRGEKVSSWFCRARMCASTSRKRRRKKNDYRGSSPSTVQRRMTRGSSAVS